MSMGIIIVGLSLLICMESAGSSSVNNCTSFQAFGKRIGDALNLDLNLILGKKFSCVNLTCNKLKCSGIPVYTRSTLKQNVTFTADIDYCSPKPRILLEVYASVFNVTANAILLDNKTVHFILSVKRNIYPSISTKFVKTNEELTITIVVKFKVPVTSGGGKTFEEKTLSGSISTSDCPRNTTKRPSTVQTTQNVTTMMLPKNSTAKAHTPKASTPTKIKPAISTPKTSKPAIKTTKRTTKTTTKTTKPHKTTINKPKTPKLTTFQPLKPTSIAIIVNPIHSKTNKTILVVLVIITVIVMIIMVIYYRKRKRLSNLPAYYNDIVLNDPLYSEIENDAKNSNDGDNNDDDNDEDGDEIPLFL